MKGLFDICILIDYLNEVAEARDELALYREKHISVNGWIEVLLGATPETEPGTRRFPNRFRLIEIDSKVREPTVVGSGQAGSGT